MYEYEDVKKRFKEAVDALNPPDVLENVLKTPINVAAPESDDNDKPKKGNIIKRILSFFA